MISIQKNPNKTIGIINSPLEYGLACKSLLQDLHGGQQLIIFNYLYYQSQQQHN